MVSALSKREFASIFSEVYKRVSLGTAVHVSYLQGSVYIISILSIQNLFPTSGCGDFRQIKRFDAEQAKAGKEQRTYERIDSGRNV